MSAFPNETVEFVIRITGGGNAAVDNVTIFDSLPAGLLYVSGSTTADGVQKGDGITSANIPIGTLSPGQIATVRFRATVSNESNFALGTTTLTNVATAQGSFVAPVSASAFVNVTRTQPIIIDNQTYQMAIQKYGRNITKGETAELSGVTASPNDTIEFIVRLRSQSSVRLNNVIVQDILPAGLSYIPNTTSLNGVIVNDGIISGLNIGSLDPNQEAIIRLSVRVNGPASFSPGNTSLINTVQARAENINVSAQLPVTVTVGQVSVIRQVSKVETGFETVFLSMMASGLLASGFAAYSRTYSARRKKILSFVEKNREKSENLSLL